MTNLVTRAFPLLRQFVWFLHWLWALIDNSRHSGNLFPSLWLAFAMNWLLIYNKLSKSVLMENSIMWIANMFSRPPFKPFDTLETIKRASQFGLNDYSYILVTLWLIQGGGGGVMWEEIACLSLLRAKASRKVTKPKQMFFRCTCNVFGREWVKLGHISWEWSRLKTQTFWITCCLTKTKYREGKINHLF